MSIDTTESGYPHTSYFPKDMHDAIPMEPIMVWTLFLLTMILHGTTFFFLDSVSKYFKMYMEFSPLQGNDTTAGSTHQSTDLMFTTHLTPMRTICHIEGFGTDPTNLLGLSSDTRGSYRHYSIKTHAKTGIKSQVLLI